MRKCASDQLSLVRLLNLRGDDQVAIHRIEAAAIIWSRPKGRRCKRPASSKARARFVSRGVQWLRFLGWLNEPERERHPHHGELAIFEKWLREERGLSDATTQSYCHAADHFFVWLATKGTPLDAIQIVDIDDAVAAEHKRGA